LKWASTQLVIEFEELDIPPGPPWTVNPPLGPEPPVRVEDPKEGGPPACDEERAPDGVPPPPIPPDEAM
jgi:hypothetical protein